MRASKVTKAFGIHTKDIAMKEDNPLQSPEHPPEEYIAEWDAPATCVKIICRKCHEFISVGKCKLPQELTCPKCNANIEIVSSIFPKATKRASIFAAFTVIALASYPAMDAHGIMHPVPNTYNVFSNLMACAMFALFVYWLCYGLVSFVLLFTAYKQANALKIKRSSYRVGIMATWGWILVVPFSVAKLYQGFNERDFAIKRQAEYSSKIRERYQEELKKIRVSELPMRSRDAMELLKINH